MAELEKHKQLKQSLAKTVEDEGNQIVAANTAATLAKMEGRAPPANLERSLDPQALDRAAKSRDEFQAIYDQVREMKRQHLNRMNASEMYHRKPAGANELQADRERTASLQQAVLRRKDDRLYRVLASETTPKRNATKSVAGPMGTRTMNATRLSKVDTEVKQPTRQTTISSVH